MFFFGCWVYLQSPFVLCRLFKKQDERVEIDFEDQGEREAPISSPEVSEFPVLEVKPENDPIIVESSLPGGPTSDVSVPQVVEEDTVTEVLTFNSISISISNLFYPVCFLENLCCTLIFLISYGISYNLCNLPIRLRHE